MTWKLSDRVKPKMGAGKGIPGTIIDLKKIVPPHGDPYVSEVLVRWDSGGEGWQWLSNLERVE